MQIEKWGVFELTLTTTSSGTRNPFTEIYFGARFTFGHRTESVAGFYDGEGVYKVRFMPDTEGEWSYVTYSTLSELDGQTATLTCISPSENNHGPVEVCHTFHFAYADDTRYLPFGTTCYAWVHQPEWLRTQTLKTLAESPFNKIRMCVFPKHYTYNQNEPEYDAFERNADGSWDFTRFNPAYFRHFEARVVELMSIGIEADVILFHPYDRWGYATMPDEVNERYLRYIVARLAAYCNVWWSFANEYDLMEHLRDRWDDYFRLVQSLDHAHHLRSIHNWVRLGGHDWSNFYDHGKPWVTHCSVQHSHLDLVPKWRETYIKPIVDDEACYEGDIPQGWGSISGRELTHRFWMGFVRGGYVGHGETYHNGVADDAGDLIWWSKGGQLRGESVSRIAFLRQIVEDAPCHLNPLPKMNQNGAPTAGYESSYYLAYLGVHQPSALIVNLPEDVKFTAEVINTWEMTITPIDGQFSGRASIPLPAQPYLAVRMLKII